MTEFRRRATPPRSSAIRTPDVREHGGQQGFSLIEVAFALGVIGSLMVSIAGLATQGARQIASGRASTQALALASSVLERVDGWSLRQTYEAFGLDGSEAVQRVDSHGSALASSWQGELEAALGDARLEIELASIGSGAPAPPLSAASAVRIVVRVRFREGMRCRALELATVRM